MGQEDLDGALFLKYLAPTTYFEFYQTIPLFIKIKKLI
jgi:hypothetical protein